MEFEDDFGEPKIKAVRTHGDRERISNLARSINTPFAYWDGGDTDKSSTTTQPHIKI